MTAPAENRIVDVNQAERVFLLNLLSAKWDEADRERGSTEPNSMEELFYLERQNLIEDLQRKLR